MKGWESGSSLSVPGVKSPAEVVATCFPIRSPTLCGPFKSAVSHLEAAVPPERLPRCKRSALFHGEASLLCYHALETTPQPGTFVFQRVPSLQHATCLDFQVDTTGHGTVWDTRQQQVPRWNRALCSCRGESQ